MAGFPPPYHARVTTAPTALLPAPLRCSTAERLVAAGVAVACAALLGVALWLAPSPDGVGTHRALGLPPCGWVVSMNLPCPSCGMTTAYSHAVRGSLFQAALVQPMGAALAVLTAAVLVVSAYVAATGSMVGHLFASKVTPRVLLVFGLLAAAAWGYKILLHRGHLPFGPGGF